jgi:hypothetical protein
MKELNTKFILLNVFKAKSQPETTNAANASLPQSEIDEMPAEAMEDELLNNLIILGVITEQQKQSINVAAVSSPACHAIAIYFDASIFNGSFAKNIIKWLLDNDIEKIQANPPNENCIFILMKGFREIEYLAAAKSKASRTGK